MSLDPSRIRALCFDLDGTLSDTDDFYVNRLARRLSRFHWIHHPHRLARRLVMWMEAPGNAVLATADSMRLDGPAIAIISWLARHRKHRTRHPPPVPGVLQMIETLSPRFPMAVVSSRDEAGTRAFLRVACLTQYFPVVVTGMSTRRTKPFPDPIRLAARELQVPAESCVMVGDTTVDIRSGRSAGAQTVGVLCGFGQEAELRRQGANAILATTADLGTLLM